MLVIVEGPDGSGKTTLINDLYKYKYKKVFGIHKNSPRQFDLWSQIMISHIKSDEYYVIDRCYLSDWAYRLAVNDGEPYIKLQDIADLLKLDGVVYVFCETSNAYGNAVKRGEDYITDRCTHIKLTYIYDFIYETLCKFTNAKCIKYNYETDNIKTLNRKIKAMLK